MTTNKKKPDKKETRLIAMHNSVARIDHHITSWSAFKPFVRGNVSLTITTPSVSLETEDCGMTYAPAESIEVWGVDNLLKLSEALSEFCHYHKLLVETVRGKGSP